MIVDVRTPLTVDTFQGPSVSQHLVLTQFAAASDRAVIGNSAGKATADKHAGSADKPEFPAWHPSARTRALEDEIALKASKPAEVRQQVSRQLLELAHVEVVVSSFTSFREVGHFQQMLAGLPNVGSILVRHLRHGTLQVRVEYRGTTKLLEALEGAYPRRFDVLSQEPYRIEIVLREAPALAERK
ncbi:MAG: hypothetical protein JWO59_3204 [Chloroflexi bacterium]|jgi:hypothetical protein|nr:hypothetical protein [Chloroflexota bacterium]MDB5076782.1 hypothetical protein [Chloroflexota bacterium]